MQALLTLREVPGFSAVTTPDSTDFSSAKIIFCQFSMSSGAVNLE